MKSMIVRLFAVSLLSLAVGVAFAQDEGGGADEAAAAADGRKVSYKATTEIDFEGLDVAGELVKPQGALLMERKRASFNPLIRLRTDFNDEMAQSVDQIK